MSDEKEIKDEEMQEDEAIELIDDAGNVIKFKLLDVTEYKGEKYALLLAAEPNDAIAEDEVAIFRYKEEEQMLEPIEDDEKLDEVFAEFCNQYEDFEDADEAASLEPDGEDK